VLPSLYDLVENTSIDEFGNNYAAIHALWTIDGLGAISKNDDAESIVTKALKHPAAGVRKAAIQILSKSSWSEDAVVKSNALYDPDPNTRLAAILSLVEISPSETIGQDLYKLSLDENVKKDEWLSKAVYAAASHHSKGFLDAFLAANPNYSAPKDIEMKRELSEFDDSAWKQMELPQYIEYAGLNIDGVVWFRKEINVPSGGKATLSLGPIDDSDVTYINGLQVGGMTRRNNVKRIYEVLPGVLRPGKNIIAIRVEDNAVRGGLYGKPEELFLQVGGKKISLVGGWKYDVERVFDSRLSMFEGTTIGKMFADNNLGKSKVEDTTAPLGNATVIRLKVIQNEMKYDLKSFTVEAGKPVQIIFENPDFMQHNLLIVQTGALETVGKAADKLAADPKGAEKNYVPDLPEVLFSTKLVNPQQTVTLNFTAPAKEGDYPYVCTFPGHWSIMNGIMKVVAVKPL